MVINEINCVGKGIIDINDINVTNNLHVDKIPVTLVSVGHVCDTGKCVGFLISEAVVLDIVEFSVKNGDIMDVIVISRPNCMISMHQIKIYFHIKVSTYINH